ncbi:MAG: FAD-binding protein, partial [Chloroflexi bacterium]|nr:FAD-binding protein [Chloroflexota bacterium]
MSPESLVRELAKAVGQDAVQAGEASRLVYSYDATFQQRLPDIVVSPTTTEQVQAALRVASRMEVPVITRGAGTSLSGGTIPMTGGIILNLARMDRILEIDKANGMAVVEPGVVNADFQSLVEAEGLFYPPDPASYRQSTLGGNVATNAGGPRGVKYGVTRDYVRGMDVALADGALLRLGGKVAKNATGYQLYHLFIGSEGTLGVITRLVLRLIPLPQVQRTARALFATLEDASEGVATVLATGV